MKLGVGRGEGGGGREGGMDTGKGEGGIRWNGDCHGGGVREVGMCFMKYGWVKSFHFHLGFGGNCSVYTVCFMVCTYVYMDECIQHDTRRSEVLMFTVPTKIEAWALVDD